ncbi:MAG: hypothetical protein QM765_38165 [Myxococcales bacterium]
MAAVARRDRGYTALYIVVTIAMFTFAMAATVSAGASDRGEDVFEGIAVAVVAAVLAAIGWGVEFGRDSAPAAAYLAVWAFIGVIVFGAIPIFGRESHPVSAATAVILVGVFAGAVRHFHKKPRRPDPFPNVLASRFPPTDILEYEGIQLVGVVPPEVKAGEWFSVRLFLQNCWDAKGQFTLELEGAKALVEQGLLRLPSRASAALEKLEVGVLEIPVWLGPDVSPGPLVIEANPETSAFFGQRLRTWRAPEVHRRVSTAVTVAEAALGLVIGHIAIHAGGGLSLRTHVTGTAVREPVGQVEQLPAQWRSLWLPSGRSAVPTGHRSSTPEREVLQTIEVSSSEASRTKAK